MVISRNSTFTYKGKATDVKQIGRDLGVRYVHGKGSPVAAVGVNPAGSDLGAHVPVPSATPAPTDTTPTTSVDDLPTAAPTHPQPGVRAQGPGHAFVPVRPAGQAPMTSPAAATTKRPGASDLDSLLSGGRK